jgi:hypothetical protein
MLTNIKTIDEYLATLSEEKRVSHELWSADHSTGWKDAGVVRRCRETLLLLSRRSSNKDLRRRAQKVFNQQGNNSLFSGPSFTGNPRAENSEGPSRRALKTKSEAIQKSQVA